MKSTVTRTLLTTLLVLSLALSVCTVGAFAEAPRLNPTQRCPSVSSH